VTEQPENQAPENAPEAPSWVPADPEKAEPEAGGQPAPATAPTVVSPPAEPTPAAVDPASPVSPVPPPVAPSVSADGAASAPAKSDRPEVAVGAAFAGGFAVAMILKRLAR